VNAVGGGLSCHDRHGFFNGIGIPACRLSERDGKNRAVSVDNVLSHDNRNAQTALFNSDALQIVEFAYRMPPLFVWIAQNTHWICTRADKPPADGIRLLVGNSVDLVHLPDVFFERHLCDEKFYTRVHG
jgi:hypothetical protein